MKNLFLLLLGIFLGWEGPSLGATFLPLSSPLYDSLSFLEAKGCLPSAILDTRPLSRREVFRLLEEASFCPQSFPLKEFHLNRLREYLAYEPELSFFRPLDGLKLQGFYLARAPRTGRLPLYFKRGRSLRRGLRNEFFFFSRLEGERFSFFLAPRLKFEGGKTKTSMEEGYLAATLGPFTLLAGRLSQHWGPQERSPLLLSENPRPFKLLLLTNESPFLLEDLGLLRLTFFVTRLGSQRAVPHPYLWGLKVVLKPRPGLELSASRTALLGGKGRDNSLKTWLKSLLGLKENLGQKGKEVGDQRFSLGLKLIRPKDLPFTLYFSLGREHLVENILREWATGAGLYLPTFLREDLSLRLEFLHTPSNWNLHYLYRSGYTYQGRGIGTHIFGKGHLWYGKLSKQWPSLGLETEVQLELAKDHFRGRDETYTLEVRRLSKRKVFSLALGLRRYQGRSLPLFKLSLTLR